MDITKETFALALPGIKREIDQATFLAIDCEITGLNSSEYDGNYDTLELFYEQLHKHIKDYLVIQFGLSIFRYVKKARSFSVMTYNFYVFPRKSNSLQKDQNFLCQASSIGFLIDNGFDFNKLFRDGIPYMNLKEQDDFLEALENADKPRNNGQGRLYVPDGVQPLVDEAFALMDDFLRNDEYELVLPDYNTFVRRMIYQSLTTRLGNRVVLLTRTMRFHGQRIVVKRSQTPEEIAEENRLMLQEAIGFSELIQFISESRKPVVGHNMLLDVAHTMNRFLIDLPEEYLEFKNSVNCKFPCIIDTKHIANDREFSNKVNSSVLTAMMLDITMSPHFHLPNIDKDNSHYSLSEPKEHEAGYDAYLTGLCLLGFWNHVGATAGYNEAEVFEHFEVLQPFMNKIHTRRVRVPYMCMDGPDCYYSHKSTQTKETK